MKDDVSKKREKNNQHEEFRLETHLLLEEKEKIMKEMQIQMKKYEEEISDLKISLNTQQKRVEFKENTNKEQFSKLNEKYQQSEN